MGKRQYESINNGTGGYWGKRKGKNYNLSHREQITGSGQKK